MVYVVRLHTLMPRFTRLEVYGDYREALLRLLEWQGHSLSEALAMTTPELSDFAKSLNLDEHIEMAEYFPPLGISTNEDIE